MGITNTHCIYGWIENIAKKADFGQGKQLIQQMIAIFLKWTILQKNGEFSRVK